MFVESHTEKTPKRNYRDKTQAQAGERGTLVHMQYADTNYQAPASTDQAGLSSGVQSANTVYLIHVFFLGC
jgi:hypothetical protein